MNYMIEIEIDCGRLNDLINNYFRDAGDVAQEIWYAEEIIYVLKRMNESALRFREVLTANSK